MRSTPFLGIGFGGGGGGAGSDLDVLREAGGVAGVEGVVLVVVATLGS